MSAYIVPTPVVYETTASDGSAVVLTFTEGEVHPADDREAAVLAALCSAGIVSVKPAATKSNKNTTPAAAEPKE